MYKVHTEKLKSLQNSLNINLKLNLNKKEFIYETNLNKLELLNPLGILKKGYSVVTKDKNVIKSYKSVKKGDKIDVRLSDGYILAEIIESRKES